MEQNIANEFNKNILCPEEKLPRAVVDQLLMLTFSFAVRLLVSTVFAEHKQYIQNFKFVLKLSDFSLTSFEVYKLLETILIDVETMDDKNNVQAVEQQPPALYTFVKHYFVEKLGKTHQSWPTSTKKLLRCELLQFGADLHDDARNLELFDEPLTNYLKAIQIDVDKCKGVTQFAEALRKILDKERKKHSFFQFKINFSHEIVEINLPNWKLPDYMQKENINELRYQKAKKTFDFLFSLSNCVPTFYEILKKN
uniref:Uncharacterized protein n=1 Tax=Globodera pallida TaxID=36090 RepID=A0A183BID8_GLOPA